MLFPCSAAPIRAFSIDTSSMPADEMQSSPRTFSLVAAPIPLSSRQMIEAVVRKGLEKPGQRLGLLNGLAYNPKMTPKI
jgi:hypothetical protein